MFQTESAAQAGHPKVSVIMPAYNGEKHIAASMRCVLEQTHIDVELIVIDDGSTDRTAEIVKEFQASDERVIYVFQKNGGQGRARNKGISIAHGELIAFLDQDDLWLKEKLEIQVRALNEDKADVVFSDGFIFRDDAVADESTPLSTWFSTLHGKFDGSSMMAYLLVLNRIPMLSVLARKDVLQSVGCFDEDRRYQNCDDYDLWLKLAENGAVFLGMSEKLVRYRLHDDQASRNSPLMIKREIAVVERHGNLTPLDNLIKQKRLQSLYRNLITSLIAHDDVSEAKDVLRELYASRRPVPFSLFERAIIKVMPGQYIDLRAQTDRLKDSFAYRIGSHLKAARRKLSALQ